MAGNKSEDRRPIGVDAENYVQRLFDMDRIRDGNRKADLISPNRRYNPKWSLELKTTSSEKCVIENYQLLYGYHSPEEYARFFGGSLVHESSFLPGLADSEHELFFGGSRVAHYHDVMKRLDKTLVADITSPVLKFKLQYGDHYIMPHDLVFYLFTAGLSIRKEKPVRECFAELKEFVRLHLIERRQQSYTDIKNDKNSMQNLNLADVRYLMGDENALKTEKAKIRIDLLTEIWSEARKLTPLYLDGPSGTKIYVLCFPSERDLFDRQVRKQVQETSPILTEVAERRKQALKELSTDSTLIEKLSNWQI